MPVLDTQRKYFSDVVKGVNTPDNSNAMQFNYEGITVTFPTTVDPIGIPVVWNDTNTAWEIYGDANAAEIAAAITANSSTLPNKAPIAIVVGGPLGAGISPVDIDFTAGEDVTALFRGANNAGVVRDGIDYSQSVASGANQTAFEEQLEKQGIMVIDNAQVVTPTYTS